MHLQQFAGNSQFSGRHTVKQPSRVCKLQARSQYFICLRRNLSPASRADWVPLRNLQLTLWATDPNAALRLRILKVRRLSAPSGSPFDKLRSPWSRADFRVNGTARLKPCPDSLFGVEGRQPTGKSKRISLTGCA